MGKKTGLMKSGFIRSVITRALAIFIIVAIIIGVVAFLSFTSEIRKTITDDKRKQLAAVENTISERMEEITSIAYNIGADSVFYFENVEADAKADIEMSKMLGRYLVGNSFIEHLAYCRTSEPDTIYVRTGKRSLSEFFMTSMGMPKEAATATIQAIQAQNQVEIRLSGSGENAYLSYLYPLPQLARVPQAHVLMLIPYREIVPLFETLLINGYGEIGVYNADQKEIYRSGNLSDELPFDDYIRDGSKEETYTAASGEKYILLKTVSPSNSWTYVAALRYKDTLSGLANKQMLLIGVILLLMVVAIVILLASVIRQYKPISNLAAQVAGKEQGEDGQDRVVDERKLLSHTMATLRDDSEQKQRYETAFYEAQAASRAKSAFLSSMSHDIRTPMNAIISMTAFALSHKDDPDYVEECLKNVQLSSDYLLDIINNVLDMSRIESGKIPISNEPLLVPVLIDNTVSLLTPSVEAKRLTLQVVLPQQKQSAVLGDSTHILQVFVNILSNAVKFTPEGGQLRLEVTQADDGEYCDYCFRFTDTGIGMTPAFVEQVFDTFARAGEPGGSKVEGTGLGMAIAKKLTELMGGTIACESRLGEGTTFTVQLHMKYADEQEAASLYTAYTEEQAAEDTQSDADLSGKRILLVEDNAMNREIARRIITETGAEVVQAVDGSEAIEIFAAKPEGYFQLILMDIQMPVMNGYEATAAIRRMDRADAATVPIYAMTANTFDEDVRQVRQAGMNGHIGKPYTPASLFKTLTHVLRR